MIKHRNEHITTNKTSIKHMLNKIFEVIWNENIDINLRVFPLTVFFSLENHTVEPLKYWHPSSTCVWHRVSLSVIVLCPAAIASSLVYLPFLCSRPGITDVPAWDLGDLNSGASRSFICRDISQPQFLTLNVAIQTNTSGWQTLWMKDLGEKWGIYIEPAMTKKYQMNRKPMDLYSGETWPSLLWSDKRTAICCYRAKADVTLFK